MIDLLIEFVPDIRFQSLDGLENLNYSKVMIDAEDLLREMKKCVKVF